MQMGLLGLLCPAEPSLAGQEQLWRVGCEQPLGTLGMSGVN